MYIKNNQLTIRNATKEDAETLATWWKDGSIMAHAGFPNGIDTCIDTLKKNLELQTDASKILIIEFDSKSIGEMNYTIEENVAEIGIKICDFAYQNHGYGTTLLKMLINFLFNDMKVKEITLDTNLKNLRAQHVYEKLGFKKVRVNIDAWENQIHELQSSVDYKLLKEDFIL
ncbi:GNAT family N-acetyltransferase [uncultured Clostridium sp.]|uniref:GNAT family N-acetyltransferase n=1 Tax=uncultured Clostridium sp. TaxID=59620 RepID=UPI002600792B|nr:GNAT family N-acetyltransferase [uncultured Clostridium sp.]